MDKLSFLFLLLLAATFSGCVVIKNKYTGLPPGIWRAVLQLEPEYISPNPKGQPLPDKVNMTYDDVKENELPFNFEVVYDNDTSFHIEIINGEERIIVPAGDISFGRSPSRARDTLRIEFPIYESYISASFAGNIIDGVWVVKTKQNYAIPFTAHHGRDYRFASVRKTPTIDLNGKWATTMGLSEGQTPRPAIAEFKQQGDYLTGTFRTQSGDYRFLEGSVLEDKFYLSCFDGSHAYLFQGKMLPDHTITGAFFSGKSYRTTWEAHRDDDFQLANPETLTQLKPGFEKMNFSFQNPEGKAISLQDPVYQGKVKLIQILGTWCPNCRDETEFLVSYLQQKKPQHLEVIGLSFELHEDPEKANQAIKTYKNRLEVPYEIVFAGTTKKEDTEKALPMLNKISAYPTLIFVDKNDRVRKIHTGFDGPATSMFEPFKKEFDTFVTELISE